MFTALATAIEELEISVDERDLTAAMRLRDRLDAKVTMAVIDFDAAELWDIDGSANLAAWLRVHTGMTHQEANRIERTARRLRHRPGLARR